MNRKLPKNWREIFAKNVLNERERLGFTQSQLASRLGMSSGSAISEWESGRGRARMDIFADLCELFERNPNELMAIDLSSQPPDPPDKTRRHGTETEIGVAALPEEGKPPKGEEVKAMKRQMLEMLLKMEEMQD